MPEHESMAVYICRNIVNLFPSPFRFYSILLNIDIVTSIVRHIRFDCGFDWAQNIVCSTSGVCVSRSRARTHGRLSISNTTLLSICIRENGMRRISFRSGLNPYKCTLARYTIRTVGQCKWTVYYIYFPRSTHSHMSLTRTIAVCVMCDTRKCHA